MNGWWFDFHDNSNIPLNMFRQMAMTPKNPKISLLSTIDFLRESPDGVGYLIKAV